MSYSYSFPTRLAKIIYRYFKPVPHSPWTAGAVADICAVNLVPPEQLITFFQNCLHILQKIKGDSIGDYLEFGVFNGSSIGSMYLAREAHRIQTMRLFGFDAFEGLPEAAEHEDDGVWKKGFYACSFEQMRNCLIKRGINPDEMTWIEGWYEHTLTAKTAAQYNITNPGIVFIDCDTYSSSKAVLDFIAPFIRAPLIICLDDWKLNDLDVKGLGEYKAFNEFMQNSPHLQATEIKSYNRKSKTFLIKPV